MFENLSNVELSVIKSAVKNDAKVVSHFYAQKERLESKISKLQKQQEELDSKIEFYNKHTRELTGYLPLELCEKVLRGSQMDWVLKYPETIIPVCGSEKEEEKEEEVKEEEQVAENNEYAEAQEGVLKTLEDDTLDATKEATDENDLIFGDNDKW